MYEAPKLEKFGAFRDLTQQLPRSYGKNVVGDDLIPGIGLDCNGTIAPTDPAACRS